MKATSEGGAWMLDRLRRWAGAPRLEHDAHEPARRDVEGAAELEGILARQVALDALRALPPVAVGRGAALAGVS